MIKTLAKISLVVVLSLVNKLPMEWLHRYIEEWLQGSKMFNARHICVGKYKFLFSSKWNFYFVFPKLNHNCWRSIIDYQTQISSFMSIYYAVSSHFNFHYIFNDMDISCRYAKGNACFVLVYFTFSESSSKNHKIKYYFDLQSLKMYATCLFWKVPFLTTIQPCIIWEI